MSDFLESCTKSSHQIGRQLLNEADCVGEQELAPARCSQPPCGRVKRGEQLVFGAHARIGQRVQQSGLAGVRVPHDRDRLQGRAAA